MAVNYSFEYRTQANAFPYSIPDKKIYKNVDSTVASLVKQIETYILAGNYNAASQLMTSNASKLDGYMINALDVNRIIEDIRNTQIYAKTRRQEIYFDTNEPTYLEHDDVWISGGTVV